MRRTAKTKVRRAVPVLRVVPRLKSGQTEIRDLIMPVAGRADLLNHRPVHFAGEIIVGPGPHTAMNLSGERRAFMNVKQVKRQMLGSQIQGQIEISFPTCERLTGQSSDQIEVDVFESGFAQALKRRRNVCRCMSAAELFQIPIVEGLRAKAGAIDSQAAEFAQLSQRQFGFVVSLRNLCDACVSAV